MQSLNAYKEISFLMQWFNAVAKTPKNLFSMLFALRIQNDVVKHILQVLLHA